MLGSQEKFLEQKVNVKFFTVDPYTPCYRVSRPFLIWSIWQICPLSAYECFQSLLQHDIITETLNIVIKVNRSVEQQTTSKIFNNKILKD